MIDSEYNALSVFVLCVCLLLFHKCMRFHVLYHYTVTKHLLSIYRAWHHGAGRFIIFFFLFLFFGVNKRTAKTSQCKGTKLGTHMIMVLKPHVQCHINITPVTFVAPRGGVKSNRSKQIRRFSTYIRRRVSEFRNGASVSKPEVEFQHGDRLFSDTGSSNISAVDWDILPKFGTPIALDVLKYETSPNRTMEMNLRRYGRHLEIDMTS